MKIIGLADCNSFYASCEKVFCPQIADKPVVVLSNNDGIVVAMSPEAKSIGIKRGTPYFKIKSIISQNDIQVFSSNYALYADLSRRVFNIIDEMVPDIEIYSIDEVFIDFGNFTGDFEKLSLKIRNTVLHNTGIPISIGIGSTKTLAKVANRIAKKYKKFNGVFDLTSPKHVNSMKKILQTIDVEDVWGVGRKNSIKLKNKNILNAYELSIADEKLIKKMLTITGLRTQYELQGTPCIKIENSPLSKKTIVTSRSFGQNVTTKEALISVVALYTTRAAEKLRKQKSLASILYVFLRTNPFSKTPQYHNGIQINLPNPSNITNELINYATKGLDEIYKDGYQYKKAGIMLSGIEKYNKSQYILFEDKNREKMQAVTYLLDDINNKNGRDTIFFGTVKSNTATVMKRELKSPHYTTNWKEIPEVFAK